MKRKFLILTIIAILAITGCRGQERPIPRGQLETNQSSIFDMARIEYCKITSDNAEVKSGFGNQFDKIGTLKRNDVVRVLDHVGDWYAVQLDNNTIGAIPTNLAQPVIREDETVTPAPDQQTPDLETDPDVVGIPAEEQEQPARDQRDIALAPTPQAPGTTRTVPGTPDDTRTGQDGLTPGGQTPGTQTPQAPEVERTDTRRTPATTEEPPIQQTPGRQQPQQQPQQQQPAEGPIRELSDQERQMVDLVNQARQQNDLQPLQVDLELTRVARIKSQDMVDQNYFSHYSPTYGSPFEMLDSFGIKYLHAGENLAGNNNVQNAHTALMNSSGHRKNILNPNFTHIGSGVRPSNRYGFIYTQLFISKPR